MFSLLLTLNLSVIPNPSQAAIDQAMIAYSIKQSKWCNPPTYDPYLDDRGEFTRLKGTFRGNVKIGPAAFSSWAMLASTLAHELEVHCNQSMVKFNAGTLLGYDMVKAYELEAYRYEVENQERFGLTPQEVKEIISTANFHYGDIYDTDLPTK